MMARLLAARGRLADAARILNRPSTLESDLALAEPRPRVTCCGTSSVGA